MTNLQLLAKELEANHYKNENGCLLTDYSKIRGLRLFASTTNGTSGMGKYHGRKVYWHQNSGLKWNGKDVVKVSEPFFEVELA